MLQEKKQYQMRQRHTLKGNFGSHSGSDAFSAHPHTVQAKSPTTVFFALSQIVWQVLTAACIKFTGVALGKRWHCKKL